MRLLVAQRLADTAGLPGADRHGVYEPRELSGSAVLAKMAKRVAPPSAKQHLAAREAEQEQREQAWRGEQAARLAEQRAKLAAGEPIRCECCLRMIESADDAVEKHGTLVHLGDCEQEWGSAYDDSDDPNGPRRQPRWTRQPDQDRPPYLLTSIADETQMHYTTHKWVAVL